MTLLPPPSVTATVGTTTSLVIPVENPEGLTLSYRLDVPGGDLPSFDSVHSLVGTPTGVTFRYTPLASHVGETELQIVAERDGSDLDAQPFVLRVEPAESAAPVFVVPGAGGTFDLADDPCVAFDLEVRDLDSIEVTIRERQPLPEGATLTSLGPKSARLAWCPSADQIDASQRWLLAFEAEDETHPPVPHDFAAILRTSAASDCPGEPPTVAVLSPDVDASSESNEVRARIADDLGLREAPLLYWTTAMPDDLERPDITAFQQAEFRRDGDAFVASVPLALDEGETRTVYYVVSATDNDDPEGTRCDLRTDSVLRTFELVGSAPTGTLSDCAQCTRSADCASGSCAPGPGGSVCLPTCDRCATGACGAFGTVEGPIREACGDAAAACFPADVCVDDRFESNDFRETASPADPGALEDLAICEPLGDFFAVGATVGDEVSAVLSGFVHDEGDLDLHLIDGSGAIVSTSAGVTNTERVAHCAREGGSLFVRVFGFLGDTNRYDLAIERRANACCVDDDAEPDDALATARPSGVPIEGTLCPGNDDVFALTIERPGEVTLTMSGDVSIELLSPAGDSLASGEGSLSARVNEAGRHFVRVFGAEAPTRYEGAVTVEDAPSCAATRECGTGEVCRDMACVSDACTDSSQCPSDHRCTTAGTCGEQCRVNADCRSGEACKWTFEGRVCGQRGAGRNGDPCTDSSDCGGQRECIAPGLGGYCARAGCTRSADCEPGTFCAGDATLRVCAVECIPGDCRADDGFGCAFIPTTEGTFEPVCWPQ
ncbi:MAG: hypothetical protein AAF645_13800 [Myxococcota bacterium]